MRVVATRILRQKDCTSTIRNARRRLVEYERYRTDHLAYQRLVVSLGTGEKATGVLCYHCRELIKIGSKYVKKVGKSGGPYHPFCAKKLHII
ncbi:MAG: hypothetical protein ACRD8Z_00320 [Nitrososphaeraceae archaeon]